MPLLVNHVKKYDVTEFENVLVPLTNAQRQPSVIAAHGERLGTMNGATVDDDGIESSDQYSAFTIEGFRAEIDNDITASGHDTVYDRRRLAFNTTLFIAGVCGLAIGGGNTWVGTCGLFAALGVGIGGNLPVDCTLFLEFLPFESGNLLTMLPFLLSRGRQAEAVATVHGIAFKNNRKTWLTVDILNAIGGDLAIVADTKMSTGEILKSQLKKFSTDRIAPPFATRRLSVMIKHYLEIAGKNIASTATRIVYRNYATTSVIGVPGSMVA
ncbi:hypothetical protein MMC06_000973 [Schaereria dolodes]|nr:hypothetical protein [Schaereria dolodes]